MMRICLFSLLCAMGFLPAQAGAIILWQKESHKFEIKGDIHLGAFLVGVSAKNSTGGDDGVNANDPISFRGKGEIDFKFGGDINKDVGYGFKIEMRTKDGGDAYRTDEFYITLKSKKFGQIYLGTTKSPASKRQVTAPEFYAKDLSAIEGQDFKPLNKISSVSGVFDLKDETDIDYDEDFHKIIYYTPRFSGFEFGIAYTPDIGRGDGKQKVGLSGDNTKGLTDRHNGDYKNAVSLSINGKHKIGGLNLKTSIGYFQAQSSDETIPDGRAWNIGARLGWNITRSTQWQIGGGFLMSDDIKAPASKEQVFIIGTAFLFDDFKLGAHYRLAKRKDDYLTQENTSNSRVAFSDPQKRKTHEIEVGGSYQLNDYLSLSSGVEYSISQNSQAESPDSSDDGNPIQGETPFTIDAEGIVFNMVLTLNF